MNGTQRSDRIVAIAFGVIGIFLGPSLLAIGYTVVRDWALAEPVASAAAPGLEQG